MAAGGGTASEADEAGLFSMMAPSADEIVISPPAPPARETPLAPQLEFRIVCEDEPHKPIVTTTPEEAVRTSPAQCRPTRVPSYVPIPTCVYS